MAFRKDQTGVAQTAANTAATMVAAAITSGVITDMETAKSEFDSIRLSTFEDLVTVVAADNVVFAEAEANAPAKPARSGGNRSNGGGGGGYAPPSLDTALATDLSFGKFRGVTLGELAGMDASQTAEYGYESGNGVKYLTYLSRLDQPEDGKKPNTFIASRAKVVLESLRSASE
jgi:hypothetical protein